MKKKGFTLVELIAVIVILSIIFLTISPIITDYLVQSKKDALRLAAEGYIRTVKINQNNTDGELFNINDGVLKNSDDEIVETSEGNNENGSVYLCKSGRTALMLKDSKQKYCALKTTNETTVKIYNYSSSCTINYDVDC